MVRKTRKNGYKRITAMIPKTLKATRNMGNKALKNVQYFLSKGVKGITNTTRLLDKKTAKTLRSLTRRRGRK